MLDQVKQAAVRAFDDYQEAWLLAAVTDWSFEEGNAADFRKYCKLYEKLGVPGPWLHAMRGGINGCLEAALQKSGLEVVSRNQSVGRVTRPDLHIRSNAEGRYGLIETKLTYDCTTAKYWPGLAADREKLLQDSERDLYQVVYSVALPKYQYPFGTWNGKAHKSREYVKLGLESQWNCIKSRLPYPTVWDAGGPLRRDFTVTAIEACQPHLQAYFESVFIPGAPWQFDSSEHLAEACVGVSLWKWR